ncbi:SigE family RNA polymerase sigma factor [Embleya sp. NBC_00896]|uniref:SigE family RNA polymerase sigma factor n=1 Tax=Embleya sp. NBC_00896 TaxID=2975961 RepID=UPI002F908C60|nr:SigE family RNA polymerase sigma factor [Embleya sp. NBC_00896]
MRQRTGQEVDDDFRGFMTSRWSRLLRAAYLLTGNHHDAEDLTQAAFARAYAKWERVDNSDNPDAYMWRILVHTNADRLRRTRLRELLTAHIPDRATVDGTGRIETRSILVEALARLPRRQRTVIVLCYFEDMSHAQAAEVLGTKATTVRSQVARALAKLRVDGALTSAQAPTAPASPPLDDETPGPPAAECAKPHDSAVTRSRPEPPSSPRPGRSRPPSTPNPPEASDTSKAVTA